MGDDAFSHKKVLEMSGGADCGELIKTLAGCGFFASVSGNNVVWVLTAGGSCVLAYYTKTGRVSQLISETRISKIGEKGSLKFNYYSSPLNWRRAIDDYFTGNDPSVRREVWQRERKYCEALDEQSGKGMT